MKILVQNGTLIDTQRTWDGRYYTDKLHSLGFSVSLPSFEPAGILHFGDLCLMPVEEVRPSIDSAREEFTEPEVSILEDKVLFSYGKKDKPPAQPPPEPSINEPYSGESGKFYDEMQVVERKKYENQYLVITKQIMQLAGVAVEEGMWPKLEDKDYQQVGLQACVNNPAVGGFMVTSLAYIHRTLKTDFEWAWENIAFRPEVL